MSDENSDPPALVAKEQELVCALHELLVCLAGGHWSEHFQRCLAELEASGTVEEKARAEAKIRSVYGGMGSFNDWYLKSDLVLGDLDELRTKVYDLSWIYQESAGGAVAGESSNA